MATTSFNINIWHCLHDKDKLCKQCADCALAGETVMLELTEFALTLVPPRGTNG